jgi:hypothetical protein
VLQALVPTLFDAVAGIIAGALVLLGVTAVKRAYRAVKPVKPEVG